MFGLILAWMFLALQIAMKAADKFGAMLAAGLGVLIGFQAVVHIAVAVWWAPPTGVPLPFISYGGTGLLISAAAATVIVSVSARRRVDELPIPEEAE